MGAIPNRGPIHAMFRYRSWNPLDKSVKKCAKNNQNTEYREVPLYGGYTKAWTYTCNVLPHAQGPIMTYKYQFSDKSVKKCSINNQNTEYREVPLYGDYTRTWTDISHLQYQPS